MGTNFYVTEEEPCPHCGRGGELRHIGKSSAGWCFSLRVYPEDEINSLEDWKKFWSGKAIEDEYGNSLTEEDMLARITERGDPKLDTKWDTPPHGYNSWDHFFSANGGERGPRGMVRHPIDTHRRYSAMTVGHGEGTWDYIEGEFS